MESLLVSQSRARRGKVRVLKLIALILIFLGISLIGMTLENFIISIKEPVELNDCTPAELVPGARVTGRITALYPAFATGSESNSGSSSEWEYYVLPIDDEHAIGYRGGMRAAKLHKAIAEETAAYIMGEGDSYGTNVKEFTGTVSEMDEQLSVWYREWFVNTGMYGDASMDTVDDHAIPYVLEEVMFDGVLIMFLAGVVSFSAACALLLLDWVLAKRKIRKSLSTNTGTRTSAQRKSDPAASEYGYSTSAEVQAPDHFDSPDIK